MSVCFLESILEAILVGFGSHFWSLGRSKRHQNVIKFRCGKSIEQSRFRKRLVAKESAGLVARRGISCEVNLPVGGSEENKKGRKEEMKKGRNEERDKVKSTGNDLNEHALTPWVAEF